MVKCENDVIMVNQATSMLAVSTKLPQLRPASCHATATNNANKLANSGWKFLMYLYIQLHLEQAV